MPKQIGSIDLKTTGHLYGQISSLENQVDNQIQTWAQSTNPATWSESDNEKHLGDLWLYTGTSDITQAGFTFHPQGIYRYIEENNTYKWEAYSSTNNNIFDLTDSKKRVFYGTTFLNPPYDVPDTPYDEHDVWMQGPNGDIKISTTTRSSGSGVASDWVLASNYIDSADATIIADNSADSRKTTEVITVYAVSSSNQQAPTTGWDESMPSVESLSGKYLWVKYGFEINNNGTYTYSTPYLANTFNGLSLFTNSVANDGYTSINGSTITTGKIQDSTGKNFIQLSEYELSIDTSVNQNKTYYTRSSSTPYTYTVVQNPTGNPHTNKYYEHTAPAGQVEFKNASTWSNSTQGLQWDSTNGELNVKGNISANQLTIVGSGGTNYNGAAAINISGYSIEIEKDSVDVVQNVSVYLYPILYHNGIKVKVYELSLDTEVDVNKTYYTRSESEPYVYTEVQNPTGNPNENEYYERQVDYGHFIWYEDDNNIGTPGDTNHEGRILGIYDHIYRVTYDFDDGAVGGGTEVQERLVDPSKYITKTSDTGITVHPETWENQSSYIQLDTNGLNLFNSNNNSIAQYGSTARVGLTNSSRFLMNTNSLQAYDNNNNKYFEVSANGITYGNNISVISQDNIGTAVNTVLNGYITYVDSENGIKVHNLNDQSNYIQMNSSKIAMYRNNIEKMQLTDSELRLGDPINYTNVNSNGLQVYTDSTEVASFGTSVRLGKNDEGYGKISITPNKFDISTSFGIEALSITSDVEVTENQLITVPIVSEASFEIGTGGSTTTYTKTIDPITNSLYLDNLQNGDTFNLSYDVGGTIYPPVSIAPRLFVYYEVSGHEDNQYTKGLQETQTTRIVCWYRTQKLGTITIDVTYDGDSGFTFSAVGTRENTQTGNAYYCELNITPKITLWDDAPIPETYVNGNIYFNSGNFGSTHVYGTLYGNNSEFNEIIAQNYFEDLNGDLGRTYELGTYVACGILTQASSRLYFSIPTGRVFDDQISTPIYKVSFNILARAGNQAGAGMYIVKSTSGGSSGASFNYDGTTAYSTSFSFYNGANSNVSIPYNNIGVYMQGGTNIFVSMDGDPNAAGNIYKFSGNSTNSNNINNQPVSLYLSNISFTLSNDYSYHIL